MNIPLIKGFKSTDISKAFILNALAIAMSAVVAIEMRVQLENEKSTLYIELNKLLPGKTISSLVKIIIVFMSAFITSMVVCIILHLLFGYGAAMIIDNKFKHKNPVYF